MKKKTESALEAWADAAAAVPADKAVLIVPLGVLRGEATDVANFARKYWKPGDDGRPGLESAVKKKPKAGDVFTAKIADEIDELASALGEAQTVWLRSASETSADELVKRGEELVGEVSRVLEWLFDDGVDDESDAQLARLKGAHVDTGKSIDALAEELGDYVTLGEEHRAEIDGLAGFDVKLLGEGREVEKKLRGVARPEANEANKASSAAVDQRNRVAALLYERMQRVRAAARATFAKWPEIVREATSAYQRRRRAEARRGKKKEG